MKMKITHVKKHQSTISKRKKNLQHFPLNKLPELPLIHLLSLLSGVDAIHFGQCIRFFHTASDDCFWKTVGQ